MSASRPSPTSSRTGGPKILGATCPVCGAPALVGLTGKTQTRCAAGHEWWAPNPGPQTRFLATSANEVLYGGAAGGGKSAATIAAPLRWVHHPHFRGLVLRRETTQLADLLDKAHELYPRVVPGAKFRGDKNVWTFPSGAKLRFNHCKEEKHARIYDGHEFQLVEFDELTHFTESQYRAIRARIRSSQPGLPRYTRATTNPGGPGHEWVFKRWGPWLDPRYELPGRAPRLGSKGERLPPAAPGEVLYFVTNERGEDVWVARGARDAEGNEAQSRTFIPARLADNPRLLENDPGYAAKLRDLDPVRRAQLRDGDWLAKPARGLYFKREFFARGFADVAPAKVLARVRYWDRAASVDGDWTVGLLMSIAEDGLIWVEDVVRFRGDPRTVESRIVATAELDGLAVVQCLEQDPGQAGKVEISYLFRALQGFNVAAFPKRVDKVTAAGPISAQSAAGNVRLLRGKWNADFLGELEEFPDGSHDDQVDAFSGAYSVLMGAEALSEDDGRLVVVHRSSR